MKKFEIALAIPVLLIMVIVTCCTVITSSSEYETDEYFDMCLNEANSIVSESCRICQCGECLQDYKVCKNDEQCLKIVKCTDEQGCLLTKDPPTCVNTRCKNLVTGAARSALNGGELLNCIVTSNCKDNCAADK